MHMSKKRTGRLAAFRFNRTTSALLASAGVVVIAGLASLNFHRNDQTVSRATPAQATSLTQPLPSDLLPVAEIYTLATAEAPGTGLTAIELERDDIYLYEVKLTNGQSLFFNAVTGAQVNHGVNEQEKASGDTAAIPPDLIPAISYSQARDIALMEKPDAVIKHIHLKMKGNLAVFAIHFKHGHYMVIDAKSGVVIRDNAPKPADKPANQAAPAGAAAAATPAAQGASNQRPAPKPKRETGNDKKPEKSDAKPNDDHRGHSGNNDRD